jgi:hypothetical protein
MNDDNVNLMRPDRFFAEVGGPIDLTRVTLGIYGVDLDPDEISALLGCSPTHAHRRGDLRPRGVPPWPKGAWLLSVEGKSPTEPEELLNQLLEKLPMDPAVWRNLRARFTVQLGFGLFLDAWNRGFDLSPATLERVSQLGASLDFNIYPEGHEDDG